MKTHQRRMHQDGDVGMCPVCGEVFRSKSGLKYHLWRVHHQGNNGMEHFISAESRRLICCVVLHFVVCSAACKNCPGRESETHLIKMTIAKFHRICGGRRAIPPGKAVPLRLLSSRFRVEWELSEARDARASGDGSQVRRPANDTHCGGAPRRRFFSHDDGGGGGG